MEIFVHFDMWNENRKILSSIFHFTMKILKNEAKLDLSEHFSRKQNGHEFVM